MDKCSNLKLYYNIREVASMMGLPEYTLRFWEKEIPSLKPKKSSGGVRQYTRQDVELIQLIHHLVKDQGLTLKAARERLKTSKQKVVDSQDIVSRLRDIRSELTELLSKLEELVPEDMH
jgi:DNA-binding transcriptional MerR regulator